MLVLTRKYNQSIMIGDQIEIVVVDIKGDQVKIGIKAPRDQTILRSEIYKEISDENVLASKSSQKKIEDALGSLMKQGGKERVKKNKPRITIHPRKQDDK